MTDGEQSFTKTEGSAGLGLPCLFALMFELSKKSRHHFFEAATTYETRFDNDGRDPGMLDCELAQLFFSDAEDEDFEGLVDEDPKM